MYEKNCIDLSGFVPTDDIALEFFYHGYGNNFNKLEIQVSWANLGIPNGTNKTVLLTADVNNNSYTDAFNVSMQQISNTRADIIIDRTDGNGWGLTSLRLHYMVIIQ